MCQQDSESLVLLKLHIKKPTEKGIPTKDLKLFHFQVRSEQELFIKKLKEWKIIVL